MSKEQKKQLGVLGLVVALVVVLIGSVLFVGAASGWFDDPKVVVDEEYRCGESCDNEFMELNAAQYEELIAAKKSFVVFVDQNGCTTAERLKGYTQDYLRKVGVKAYRMMFEDAKESSLHDFVKYYPSVVVVSKGKVVGYLRADSDEDAEMYNDFGAFENWIKRYL